MKRRFEYVAGNSAKFWEVSSAGRVVYVHYGRLGTPGQRLTKPLANAAQAEQHVERLIAQKLRKGYREVQPSVV